MRFKTVQRLLVKKWRSLGILPALKASKMDAADTVLFLHSACTVSHYSQYFGRRHYWSFILPVLDMFHYVSTARTGATPGAWGT